MPKTNKQGGGSKSFPYGSSKSAGAIGKKSTKGKSTIASSKVVKGGKNARGSGAGSSSY